jgi:hypothetical protein
MNAAVMHEQDRALMLKSAERLAMLKKEEDERKAGGAATTTAERPKLVANKNTDYLMVNQPPLEQAYLMNSMNRIADYDTKYEYDIEDSRPVLKCDEMVRQ